jgi:hypothetical protein
MVDPDRPIPTAEWHIDILKVSISDSGSSMVIKNRTKSFLKVLPQDARMMAMLKGRREAYFEFSHDLENKQLHVGPEVTGLYW